MLTDNPDVQVTVQVVEEVLGSRWCATRRLKKTRSPHRCSDGTQRHCFRSVSGSSDRIQRQPALSHASTDIRYLPRIYQAPTTPLWTPLGNGKLVIRHEDRSRASSGAAACQKECYKLCDTNTLSAGWTEAASTRWTRGWQERGRSAPVADPLDACYRYFHRWRSFGTFRRIHMRAASTNGRAAQRDPASLRAPVRVCARRAFFSAPARLSPPL